MTPTEIVLLGLALSVDAFIVSFAYGLAFNQNRIKTCLLLSLFTGGFQGLFPCIGAYLTTYVKHYIEPYTPWIVCTLFIVLGISIIKESLKEKDSIPKCVGLLCLFLIGIATSIDAFSAGISLALYNVNIFKPALLFTIITFVNSIMGFFLGWRLKKIPQKNLQISAGIIFIILGLFAIFN